MSMSLEAVKSMVTRYEPEIMCVKNAESKFIEANDAFLSFFGFADMDKLYHKTDYDLPGPDYAPQYICNDQEAMLTGEIQVFEPTVKYSGELHLLLTHKYPFYNETTKASGVVGVSKIINHNTIKRFMPFIERYDFNQLKVSNALFGDKVNQYVKVALTDREMDIFYYLLHGLCQKQIANKLNLSVRTVEDYVDHVKAKLNCFNKSQLFEFALQHGLMNIVPKHLLS